MKILFFIESLRAGGKERRIVELLKGLIGYDEVSIELVLTRNEIHYNEVLEMGIPIHIIERKYIKKDPLLFFRFYFLAKKIKPDIIHVWGHMVAVYAVPSKWILRLPLLNNEITDSTPNQKLIARSLVFKASDRIIANTEAGLLAYSAPLDKSRVIYNGFNFSRLSNIQSPELIRMQFNISSRFVIGMVASFSDNKDYTTYITTALVVLQQRNDVTFLCVGEGDDQHYRDLVPDRFKDRIKFLGKQNPIEPIINICDIGVLTTNIKFHGEGISNALMEFMGFGKPVIATNYGGSIELIKSPISGFLIEAFSHCQLSEKINFLLDNEEERIRMGECGTKRIRDYFSIQSMVKEFYEEYCNVIR